MRTKVKPGVRFHRIQNDGTLVIWNMLDEHEIIAAIFACFGAECVITSACDGVHSPNSLHYVGWATDYRTRHLPAARRIQLRDAVADALGDDYDVVLEATHLHVEYDPEDEDYGADY